MLRPDVNESDTDFTVVGRGGRATSGTDRARRPKKVIRFGLGAVKGVGEGAVEVDQGGARRRAAPFLSLFDFCKRVDGRKVNRKVIEALVKAGAFDGVAAAERRHARARVRRDRPGVSERAAEAQRERESGQTNLLALFGGGGSGKQRHRRRAGRGQVPAGRRVDAEGAARLREGVRSASTSAATRWIATPARSAASPTPPPPTASRRASAPR